MLVLASASPRRKDLLLQAGLSFTVDPAHIDESAFPGELAANYVCRIAEEKARAVFERYRGQPETATVLAADTCVLLESRILGKPAGRAEAFAMLQELSGRTHQVITGIAAVNAATAAVAVEVTQVTFNLIPPDDLETYLDTGESLDKAGGYGIQGYAARWIPRIEGSYDNVVGLPLARTIDLLATVGWRP